MAVRTNPIFHRNIVRYSLCANCWGDLHEEQTEEKTETGFPIYMITCSTPGCPCHGFVSKHHIEYMETIAGMERKAAYEALKGVVPWVRLLGPRKDMRYLWDPETERYAIPARRKSFAIQGLDF